MAFRVVTYREVFKIQWYNLSMPTKPQAKDYEVLEHTADVGIVAYGKDLKQTFTNAARGMFSLVTSLNKVRAITSHEISVSANNKENLLVEWLNELIFLFDTEHFISKRFKITDLDETKLKAIVYGEKTDLSRHKINIGIKATTYHMLEIKQTDKGYEARVIFDI